MFFFFFSFINIFISYKYLYFFILKKLGYGFGSFIFNFITFAIVNPNNLAATKINSKESYFVGPTENVAL